ncbi:MAG TPA: caspase family protein, partial [Gemmataceae bacterium]|nr:caspase family protein [Gemmataceae bacterium]
MEYEFRPFAPAQPLVPAPGELHLRPHAPNHPQARSLALLAVEEGPEAFVHGEGPIQRIIIQPDPTLDDMLAATFLEYCLTTGTLPTGAGAFARYSHLARRGLKPGSLPLAESLAGVYLAIRYEGGHDLAEPAARARFLLGWSRMARRIVKAAETCQNPLTTALFTGSPEFAEAQAFLAHDGSVYEHQDVARGQSWLVRIPGGPRQAVPGLLLGSPPKSILWKYWSREDPHAPGSHGYVFLAMYQKARHWRFSTDPVHRLSIKSLAEELQKAEARKNPTAATSDPWFDGAPWDYTLVGAPRAGTALSDRDVLRIVKRWGHVRRPRTWKPVAIAGLAAVLLLTLFSTGTLRSFSNVMMRGLEWVKSGDTPDDGPDDPDRKPNLYLLTVGVSQCKQAQYDLDYADNDAEGLAEAFKAQKGQVFTRVYGGEALTNEQATRETIIHKLEALAKQAAHARPDDVMIIALAGHGLMYNHRDFYFVPYNFDGNIASGVSWYDVRTPLSQVPCTVVV